MEESICGLPRLMGQDGEGREGPMEVALKRPTSLVGGAATADRLAGSSALGLDVDRTARATAKGAGPNGASTDEPTTATMAPAYSMIGGAIWPTQIWLSRAAHG